MTDLTSQPLLEGKTAVVTGANRGIGRAITEVFLAHGATVLACARNVEGTFDGLDVTPVGLDLSDEASIKAAIKDIRTASKTVDILVNCAGIASGAVFQMTSMTELRNVFEVNFFGQIALSQGISRLMARHKAGSIINISSTAADNPEPGTIAYGSSKAAFERATQSMATELGGQGIRVNAIAPGVTQTDMADQMDPHAREKLIEASALKKAAEPHDIANAAVFLASNLSSHITGQVIRVDGGMI
ncbi:SDR family oxidoreductase [Magnetovibrio sp. PR-2]|uniref:SDR family NAD(P)-dependent oxidoreductase n=1 Tax=Magnetovibrio sp. PR-2 TaxID=3120356 RepID=UPI002FCE23FF